MDKNTIYGLVIIGLLLFGFTWYSNREKAELDQQRATADSIYKATHPAQQVADSAFTASASPHAQMQSAIADSVLAGQIGGSLVASMKGEEAFLTIENDKIRVSISTLGGRIASVELKEYKSYHGGQLVLFNRETSKFDTRFLIRNNYGDAPVNTAQYYFTAVPVDDHTLAMRLHVDSTAYVEYLYTLAANDYMVGMNINFKGMGSVLSNQSDISLEWENIGNHNEKGFDNENTYCDLTYMYPGTDSMEKLGLSKESEDKQENGKIKWIAFKQQFFSSVFIADGEFSGASMRFDTYKPGSGFIKKYNARISVPFDSATESYGFKYYFGPNKFSQLESYNLGLQKLVPLGWGIFGWINEYLVIPVFDFLSRGIASFGLIILLLTIFIKLIISPLTYKSYLSTAKMRLLKPEIDEITAKYPKTEDMAKKQQATMELYKKAGVSPMGGCLPMLIQFPFLIAMFRFFPAAIELRQESFLWADDLSSYDSILNLPLNIPFYGDHISLFTLLMAVSMYFVARMSSSQMASAGPQMAGMKFMSLYLMPVMMLFWFNNYASGLTYYYMLSSVITVLQTYAFRYAVDDHKLHTQMKANAKKPRKKNKWTERYEQMLKEQQKSGRK